MDGVHLYVFLMVWLRGGRIWSWGAPSPFSFGPALARVMSLTSPPCEYLVVDMCADFQQASAHGTSLRRKRVPTLGGAMGDPHAAARLSGLDHHHVDVLGHHCVHAPGRLAGVPGRVRGSTTACIRYGTPGLVEGLAMGSAQQAGRQVGMGKNTTRNGTRQYGTTGRA